MSTFHVNLVNRVHLFDIPPTKWAACKNVLKAIADHASEEEADTAYPGIELLMLETGCSESVITRTTTLLAKTGWISRKRRSGTSNLYRLNVAKLEANQVQRKRAVSVFIAEHMDDLAFPGEDVDMLKSGASPTDSQEPRSTARKREKSGSDQPSRQIDGGNPSNRREGHAKSTGTTDQIDDLTIREPSGSHQPTSAGAPASESTAGDADSSTNDGWGKTAPQKTKTEEPDSSGALLLRSLRAEDGTGLNAAAIAEHADQVTAWLEAGHTEKSIRLHLSGGRSAGFIRSKLRKLVAGEEHLPARRVDLRPMYVRPAQPKAGTPENLAERAGPNAFLPTRLRQSA